jgi:pimeloyl-ACP methyl ester carboxylesterase
MKRSRLRLIAGALTTGLTLVVVTAATAAATSAAHSAASGVSTAPTMRVATVCFKVSAPGRTTPLLFGLRYFVGHPAPNTPAIVLVHGVESDTSDWDYTPSWSVARWLADAGYVVYSYDRLGYANSPYSGPGGGQALTLPNALSELHRVIESVHRGTYRRAAASNCLPATRKTSAGLRSNKVVLVGHSLGGFIVDGYPGRYHDVSALVQADSDAGLSYELAHGSAPSGTGPAPTINAQGYDYLFRTRAGCAKFDFFEPGVVPAVARVACDPRSLPASPVGEADLVPLDVINNEYIPDTRVPVLLTWGAEDPLFPPSIATLDYTAWTGVCNCSVSRLELPQTGHLFMAHRSLPLWTGTLVRWLRSHGIAGNSVPDPVRTFPPR